MSISKYEEKAKRRKTFEVGDKVIVPSMSNIFNKFSFGDNYTFPMSVQIEEISFSTSDRCYYAYFYLINKEGEPSPTKAKINLKYLEAGDTNANNFKPYDIVVHNGDHVFVVVCDHPDRKEEIFVQRTKGSGGYYELPKYFVPTREGVSTFTCHFHSVKKAYQRKITNACYAFTFKKGEYNDVVALLQQSGYKIKVHNISTTSVYTLYMFVNTKKAVIGKSNKKSLISPSIEDFIPNFKNIPHHTIETGFKCFKNILESRKAYRVNSKAFTLPASSAVAVDIALSSFTTKGSVIGKGFELPVEPEIKLTPIQLKSIEI